MEQRSMSDVIKQLQPLLRKFEKDDGLVIEKTTDTAGSKIGDNYTSIMIRTRVLGKYGNGSPYDKSFMTKVMPHGRALNDVVQIEHLFFTEKHAYETLLPILGDFGPRCVYAGPEELIMEDLREKGYTLCERKNYLDLEHCLHVIKTLATLHARGLAVKLTDPATFQKLIDPLKEVLFDGTGGSIGKSLDNTVVFGIEHLESIEPRTAVIAEAIDYLNSFDGNCFEALKKLVIMPVEEYFVILHGDPWKNNILFKYDDNGRLVDLKMVDYQILRHLSVAMDFHYFVYTSARSDVIEEHYDQLVEHYHRNFMDTLKSSGISEEKRRNLGMDWFRSELKRFALYGLFTGLWLVHAILTDDDHLPDLDKITMNEIESMTLWSKIVAPVKAERIKCVCCHFMRTYRG